MLNKEQIFLNIPKTIARLYDEANPAALGEVLTELLAEEKKWTKSGFSDGFYVYAQIQAVTERAMKESDTDMTSFLLSWQNRHFDASFKEAAEENALDLDFGLKDRPRIYYSPGSVLEFGSYLWTDLEGAPADPVKWESLALAEDRALLLAKHGLDCMPYHDALQDTTWEESALRKWLNTDFFESVFSLEEQEQILQVTNRNPDNVTYHMKGGNDTADRIFLLSSEEFEGFCTDSCFRQKTPSPYAKKNGAVSDETGHCRWLLRSPGNMWMSAACINGDGEPDDRGVFVQDKDCCVCPALWIRLA